VLVDAVNHRTNTLQFGFQRRGRVLFAVTIALPKLGLCRKLHRIAIVSHPIVKIHTKQGVSKVRLLRTLLSLY